MLKFILILTLPLIAEASLIKYCQDIYSRFFSNETVEYLSDKVSIVYFPGHTEILVNGTLYNPNLGYRKNGGEESLYMRGSTFARFKIRVTEEELRDMVEYVERYTRTMETCVSGACRPVTKFTGLPIPPPFNTVPVLNAAYLGFLKTTGLHMGRIEKIELQGPIKKWAAFDSAPLVALAILITTVITIPIVQNEKEKEGLKISAEIILNEETPIELTTFKLAEEKTSPSVVYEDTTRHYIDILAAGKTHPHRLSLPKKDIDSQHGFATLYDKKKGRAGIKGRYAFFTKDSVLYANFILNEKFDKVVRLGTLNKNKDVVLDEGNTVVYYKDDKYNEKILRILVKDFDKKLEVTEKPVKN
jgi:hypothetical protein